MSDGQADVVHEIVFRAWPQMVEWLEEARADLVLERDLRASARAWDAQGRSDDDVLRGARLHAAADWSARTDHPPPLVIELHRGEPGGGRSRRAGVRAQLRRERRGRRRLRVALALASILLLVAATGGVLAVRNSRQAEHERDRADAATVVADGQHADAERERDRADAATVVADGQRADAELDRLVAESRNNRDRDLALSLLLAVEAHRRTDSAATRGALLDAMTHNSTPGPPSPGNCCRTVDAPRVKSSFAGFISGPDRMTAAIELSHDGRVIAHRRCLRGR